MNFDVIVIGSGPGGYVTAIRASQRFENRYCRKRIFRWCLSELGVYTYQSITKSAQVFEYIGMLKISV